MFVIHTVIWFRFESADVREGGGFVKLRKNMILPETKKNAEETALKYLKTIYPTMTEEYIKSMKVYQIAVAIFLDGTYHGIQLCKKYK